MADLVMKNAMVISQSVTGLRDVVVSDGVISAVTAPGESGPARRVVDVDGLTLVPGAVDAHVHFRDPGGAERETFISGSRAAAAGGVTTVLEMPTSEPSVLTRDILLDRARHLADRSVVDFALYGAAGPDNLDEVPLMARAGAVAFKTFMHDPPPERAATIGPLCATDNATLLRVMRAVAATGRIHAIHAEDEDILTLCHPAADATGDFATLHRDARPPLAEEMAVARAATLARESGVRLHLVHISHPDAVRHVVAQRAWGLDATVETAPHYLCLNDSALEAHAQYAKCNPPMRPEGARAELMAALVRGDVAVVASDHCPCAPAELDVADPDPLASPAGLAGIEYMLPMMLTRVAAGEVPLDVLVRALSYAPARRFGLLDRGDIAVGQKADLAVLDLAATWQFGDRPPRSMGGTNLRYLQDHPMTGRVHQTWLGGELLFADDEVQLDPGAGAWVRPGPDAG